MKVLIVEDETVAQENLRAILEEVNPSIEVVGCTESVIQTVRWFARNPAPELIFMDIHLSDGSAFNIFNAITIEVPIIFTTAYDEYAIEAFKVTSIDYLLKPLEVSEMRRALDKLRTLTKQKVLKNLAKLPLMPSGTYPEKMLIPLNDKLIPVEVSQISYFYTTLGNTRAALKEGKSYSYPRTLDNIYDSLDPQLFIRANKQYILAKKSIKNITVCPDSRLCITVDTQVPEPIFVSKNKAAMFKRWMI